MRFTGTFKNRDNTKEYKVTIGRDDEAWTPIVAPDAVEFNSYKQVCFDVDPVHITCTRDDLQQRILIRQCTISLVTKMDMSQMLIADTNRTIPVTVELVSSEDGSAAQHICTLFEGFMDPLTFSQGMAHNYETYTIHATDPMGALNDLKVDCLTSGNDNFGIDGVPYIGEVITRVLLKGDMTLAYDQFWYDDTVGGMLPNYPGNNERVNMSVFFGDDQDDWMTLYEILETICKFNGYLAYYNPIDGYAHITPMYNPKIISCGLDLEHKATDDSTALSTDDVYSQVTLQCDIEPNDDDVSLIDDDFLRSDYYNYQRYMTELAVSGSGWDELMALKELCNSDNGKEYTSNTNGRRTEHYVYVKRNDQWSFGSNSYITAMNGAERTDNADAVPMTGDQSEVLTWLKNNPGKGAFISFGKGNDIKANNQSRQDAPKMTDYFVVSIQGHNDHREYGHYTTYQSIFGNNYNNYICKFMGLESKNLTPPDDTITNYILISGKVILNPLQAKTGVNWSWDTGFPGGWHDDPWYNNLYNASTNTFQSTKNMLNSLNSFWDSMMIFGRNVPSNDDKGEYYTQKWWSCSDPRTSNYSLKSAEGLIGFLGNKNNELCKYAWSGYGEENDEIDKLPILVCTLKIGDKWAVELMKPLTQYEITNFFINIKPEENKKGNIIWLSENQWGGLGIEPVFSIGFDPQIDDCFVGHEFKISKNFEENLKIEGEGTAIPIRLSDKLNGKVEFSIIRPYNICEEDSSQFNRIERVHPTWLRSTSWNDHNFWILEFLDSIMLSDFKIEIKTDAGKIDQKMTTADNDLVYYSNTFPSYIEKLEDEIKICSALTMEECQQKGIKYQTSNSYVTDDDVPFLGWSYGTDSKVKPEEMYVDYYFTQYNNPMRILETKVKDTVFVTGNSAADDIGYKMAMGWCSGDLSYGMPNPIENASLMEFDWDLGKREIDVHLREMADYTPIWSE